MANTENTDKKKKGIRKFFPEKGLYIILLLLLFVVAIAFLVMIAVMNSFPASMTMALIVSLFVMLALVWFLFKRKKKGLRIAGIVLAVLFLGIYGLGTYYMGSTYAMFAQISGDEPVEVSSKGLDLTKDSFNVYITGIDQWAKEKGLDLERSDVNMIVTVNPQTRKILLTSIPRDTYVELYHVPEMDKLTHTGIYGVDETIKTVEKWLGLDLHYYVKMNFSAVRDIINAMDGIDVYSPVAFKSSISGYEYVRGINHCNGKKALFFARERKAFLGKDSIRVENQQRVVQACLDKLLSSTTLLTKYGDIMKAAGKNLQTDMKTKDIQSLVKMQLQDLGAWDVQTQKVDGEYDMDYVASLTQEQMFQIYRPNEESVRKVLANINAVMNPTQEEIDQAIEQRKKSSAINFIRGLLGRKSSDPAAEEEGE